MRSHITRSAILAASVALIARNAGAQGVLSTAKAKAQTAASAANAHTAAEQQPEVALASTRQPVPTVASIASPTVGMSPTSKTKQTSANMERPADKLAVQATDTTSVPPSILRETYSYEGQGRRDPFVSLLTTNELRPTLSDLRLTGIIFDHSPERRSVATLRDLGTNAQYRVTLGTKLGRMTVAAIRLKVIVFTIDEFGTTRQDSLVIGDSTKVRGK